jgi:hypothetical protein
MCSFYLLCIHDFLFHDLRHEATSRLFERGYQIHEVAQFTLHDSWSELKRYTNLKPENLREIMAPALLADARVRVDRSIAVDEQPSRSDHQSHEIGQLTSQGDFCPPRRKTGHGSLAGARRLASSKLKPKYFGATRARGMWPSPNSANRPKYVLFTVLTCCCDAG